MTHTKGFVQKKSMLFWEVPGIRKNKTEQNRKFRTVRQYRNFNFFCDFFLLMKFEMQKANLIRIKKKNTKPKKT